MSLPFEDTAKFYGFTPYAHNSNETWVDYTNDNHIHLEIRLTEDGFRAMLSYILPGTLMTLSTAQFQFPHSAFRFFLDRMTEAVTRIGDF